MDNMTRDFIYAMKLRDKPREEALIDFMCEQTLSPRSSYPPSIVERVARRMFVDYISTCDNPAYEVDCLLEMMDHITDKADALIATLELVQVRNDGKYVNGFSDEGES